MKEINKEKVAKTAKKVAKVLGKTALVFAGGTLVVGGAMSLMGCPGPTDAKPVVPKVYGSITDDNGVVINIYNDGGISEVDMAKAVLDIQAGYASLLAGSKINFATKGVTEIRVAPTVPGSGSFAGGTIKVDLLGAEYFDSILSTLGLISLQNINDTIRLASSFDTLQAHCKHILPDMFCHSVVCC